MGTLRSTQWLYDAEGNRTSPITGHIYNGVLFGQPVEIDNDPVTAEFDDSAFPNGVVALVDGVIIVTPDEEPLV